MAAEIINVYVLMVSICTGTVKPVFRDHSEESKKMVSKHWWSLNTGKFHMECDTVVIEKEDLLTQGFA